MNINIFSQPSQVQQLERLNKKWAGNIYKMINYDRAQHVEVIAVVENPFIGDGPQFMAYVTNYPEQTFTDYIPLH